MEYFSWRGHGSYLSKCKDRQECKKHNSNAHSLNTTLFADTQPFKVAGQIHNSIGSQRNYQETSVHGEDTCAQELRTSIHELKIILLTTTSRYTL